MIRPRSTALPLQDTKVTAEALTPKQPARRPRRGERQQELFSETEEKSPTQYGIRSELGSDTWRLHRNHFSIGRSNMVNQENSQDPGKDPQVPVVGKQTLSLAIIRIDGDTQIREALDGDVMANYRDLMTDGKPPRRG
jgi:hypothetical protein